MSIFNTISKTKSILFGGGEGGNSGFPSLPRQTAIDLAQETPTSRLDKNPLDFSTLSYPKDLINDATNGHYMLFYINMQNKTRFPYTQASDGLYVGEKIIKGKKTTTATQTGPGTYTTKDKYGEVIENGAIQETNRHISQALSKQQTKLYGDVSLLRKSSNKMRTGLGKHFNPTVRIHKSIAIYLPPNVQDNYSTKYSGAETGLMGFFAASGGAFMDAYRNDDFDKTAQILLDTFGGIAGQVGMNAALSVAEMLTSAEGGVGLANKVFGQTTNPYMEVLFQGVDLRTFTYNFTFAPRNREEQEEVKAIIQLFRFHQAPELRNNESIFMGLPSEFDIHYMYQHEDGTEARENLFYNKIATCVLTNCSVDYTPGAVQSHNDGSPVQIKMSLSFLETEMITKDHVRAGY